MRWLRDRLVITMTLAFVALAVAQPGSTATAAASVALVAVAALLASQWGAGRVLGREITVGGRARQHRESLSGMAAPRHPSTPGRPLARAPGRRPAAA